MANVCGIRDKVFEADILLYNTVFEIRRGIRGIFAQQLGQFIRVNLVLQFDQ